MSELTRLANEEIEELRRTHPGLPDDYVKYLADVGWGEAASGRMIYGSPLKPEEVYGPSVGLKGVVLLGDDFQGYCLGFNVVTRQYGEVSDFGEWEPWTGNEGINEYANS